MANFPLKIGSSGPEVANLQRFLNAWLGKVSGASLDKIQVARQLATDGKFGNNTERAARLFFYFSAKGGNWPGSAAAITNTQAIALSAKTYDYYVTANGFDKSRSQGSSTSSGTTAGSDPTAIVSALVDRDKRTVITLTDAAAVAASGGKYGQYQADIERLNSNIEARAGHIKNNKAYQVNQASESTLQQIENAAAKTWAWITGSRVSGIGAVPVLAVWVLGVVAVSVVSGYAVWTWLTPANNESVADSKAANDLYDQIMKGECQGANAEECTKKVRELIAKGEQSGYAEGKSDGTFSLSGAALPIAIGVGLLLMANKNE